MLLLVCFFNSHSQGRKNQRIPEHFRQGRRLWFSFDCATHGPSFNLGSGRLFSLDSNGYGCGLGLCARLAQPVHVLPMVAVQLRFILDRTTAAAPAAVILRMLFNLVQRPPRPAP